MQVNGSTSSPRHVTDIFPNITSYERSPRHFNIPLSKRREGFGVRAEGLGGVMETFPLHFLGNSLYSNCCLWTDGLSTQKWLLLHEVFHYNLWEEFEHEEAVRRDDRCLVGTGCVRVGREEGRREGCAGPRGPEVKVPLREVMQNQVPPLYAGGLFLS